MSIAKLYPQSSPTACFLHVCNLFLLGALACSQAVAHHRPEAVSVRLGGILGQPQAQLDGFKSRALCAGAGAQRNLYITEWRRIQVAGDAGAEVLVISDDGTVDCECLLFQISHAELVTALYNGKWAAVALAVATQHGCLTASSPLTALEAALALVQTQASRAPAPNVWLLTTGAQVGFVGAGHAGSWGLSRSARAEASLPVICIDGPVHKIVLQGSSCVESETVLLANEHSVPRLMYASNVTGRNAHATSESHLITGGTSGLGLLTARWLAQRGATLLTLASRSGRLARDMANEWEHVQATIVPTHAQRCDTAETTHVRRVLLSGHAQIPAIGVWHAAGVLADSVLPKQTAGSLAWVYAPKVHGAWTLQSAFICTPLRMCALFSSVAALLGGAGQANYSAANACLDALAASRRANSTTSTSVQWGAWAELGMAARGAASVRMAAMEAASGFARIGLAQGLAALHVAVLPRAASFVGVVPVQWHRMLGGGMAPAFLTTMIPRSSRERFLSPESLVTRNRRERPDRLELL